MKNLVFGLIILVSTVLYSCSSEQHMPQTTETKEKVEVQKITSLEFSNQKNGVSEAGNRYVYVTASFFTDTMLVGKIQLTEQSYIKKQEVGLDTKESFTVAQQKDELLKRISECSYNAESRKLYLPLLDRPNSKVTWKVLGTEWRND